MGLRDDAEREGREITEQVTAREVAKLEERDRRTRAVDQAVSHGMREWSSRMGLAAVPEVRVTKRTLSQEESDTYELFGADELIAKEDFVFEEDGLKFRGSAEVRRRRDGRESEDAFVVYLDDESGRGRVDDLRGLAIALGEGHQRPR